MDARLIRRTTAPDRLYYDNCSFLSLIGCSGEKLRMHEKIAKKTLLIEYLQLVSSLLLYDNHIFYLEIELQSFS
jgi:hypothetical protein